MKDNMELEPTSGDRSVAEIDSLPFTLTIPEAAKLLRIGRNSAYEAVRRGDLPVIRIGHRLLVPRQALLEMLSSTAPAGKAEGLVRSDRGRSKRKK